MCKYRPTGPQNHLEGQFFGQIYHNHHQLEKKNINQSQVVFTTDSDTLLFLNPSEKAFSRYSHPSYSYLPNKRAGPNKRVGWKMGQN